jgi:hypothetical protein
MNNKTILRRGPRLPAVGPCFRIPSKGGNERCHGLRPWGSTSRLVLIFSLLALFPPLSLADKIYLKDGKVYEGKIIGRSDRRYLFSLDTDGEFLPVSFFLENVAKVELSKDSVAKQIPYLKEVESTKMAAGEEGQKKEENQKVYELSLYKKGQTQPTEPPFSDADLVKILSKEEYDYYLRYNEILRRYADKVVAIENIYADLTKATKQDFTTAKGDMEDLYYELNSMPVPESFKKSHASYLESVKATYLGFSALEQGLLEEASKQIKISDDAKQRAASEFRETILNKKNTTVSK